MQNAVATVYSAVFSVGADCVAKSKVQDENSCCDELSKKKEKEDKKAERRNAQLLWEELQWRRLYTISLPNHWHCVGACCDIQCIFHFPVLYPCLVSCFLLSILATVCLLIYSFYNRGQLRGTAFVTDKKNSSLCKAAALLGSCLSSYCGTLCAQDT